MVSIKAALAPPKGVRQTGPNAKVSSAVYSSPTRDPRTHAVNVALAVEVRGEPAIRDPLEISEIHAFAPADIPFAHLAFDGEQQLRDYLDGTVAVR